MISNGLRHVNVLVVVLTITLVSSVLSLGSGVSVGAAPKTTPDSITTWMDDKCYSTPATLTSLGNNLFNPFNAGDNLIGKFGLVNAIVRIPIYDWDQTPPLAPDILSDSISPSFNAPSVKPIGYVERFTGTVTPLPNIRWMQEYATKQAPFDLGMLATLINPAMKNPVPLPDPSIANPLLYQRASVINKYGVPNVTFSNPDFQGREPGSDPGDVNQDNLEDMGDAVGNGNGQIIGDNVPKEEIEDIKNNPGGYNKDTAGSGFGLTGARFSVDKANPADNCYEYLDTAAKKVPAYAFSVPKFGIPITYFGSFFSVITMFAGKGPSFSGFTFYPESENGKMMLDCYGRGITPTLVPSGTSIGNHQFSGIFGAPNIFTWEDPLKVIVVALDAAITQGASLTNPAAWVLQRLPMPKLHRENYFNGMAYLFTIDPIQQSDLPDSIRGRDIEVFKSASVNTKILTNYRHDREDNGGHDDSNNGSTYFPNLYIKLKKPFRHNPRVESVNITPDGNSFAVKPQIDKDGFKPKPQKYSNEGTRNDAPVVNTAKARIAEVVLRPGQTGNEIRQRQFEGADLGTTNGLNPAELCGFLRTQLNDPSADCDADKYGGEINISSLANIGGEDDRRAIDLVTGGITRDIPAETPPGTKFCYAIYLNKRDNDLKFENEDYYKTASNWNPGYKANRDKRFLSKTYCVISAYKPSLQVRGGDMIATGNVSTDTNRKDDLGSDATPKEKRTFGSWAEYGLYAGGSVTGAKMGSGAKYRVGQANPAQAFDPEGLLTFSNRYSVSGEPSFGNFKANMNDGAAQISAFFDNRTEAATPIAEATDCLDGDIVRLQNCASGDYRLTNTSAGGAPTTYKVDGDGFSGQKDKSLVFIVGDNVTVELTNNIETHNDYATMTELSQVVFTPEKIAPSGTARYLVNIADVATRIDAWLINPTGAINTCYRSGVTGADVPTAMIPGDPVQAHPCYTNRLLVNGPVVAERFFLRRSGGQDQNPAGNPPKQSVAGETFNLRPDAYLWAMNQPGKAHQKFTTVDIKDLPPRY